MGEREDKWAAEQELKTQHLATGSDAPLKRYRELIVGPGSFGAFLYYEWCMWLALVPGALGLFLRRLFWPRMFGSCGRKVAFGSGVVVRHPKRIHLGHRVVIGEGCILDARHTQTERALVLGNDVSLSNDVMISCKEAPIQVGDRTGLGARTIVHAARGNPVSIGEDVVIGALCYMVGGSDYNLDSLDEPISHQGIKPDGGIKVEDGVWMGARVTVLGGVTLGVGSVAGAGAVVTKSVPALAVALGSPAKIAGWRKEGGVEPVNGDD